MWLYVGLVSSLTYWIAFACYTRKRGWNTSAFAVGCLHLLFACANSVAPWRSLLDAMYMGWQIGLVRFEGRAATLPSLVVLLWSLAAAFLAVRRMPTRWMRLVAWGDGFWLLNFLLTFALMAWKGQLREADIQAG